MLCVMEVKIRGSNQGLGPIPAPKNEVLGLIPESKHHVVGPIPHIRTRNCFLWDLMPSSNPISSTCGELMGLRPMLLPNYKIS